jgi:VanZ family protein
MIVGFTKQTRYFRLRQNPVKYSLAISLSYASILELGQAFIPDRYANIYDIAFNLAGVVLGYLIFIIIYKLAFD